MMSESQSPTQAQPIQTTTKSTENLQEVILSPFDTDTNAPIPLTTSIGPPIPTTQRAWREIHRGEPSSALQLPFASFRSIIQEFVV